MARSCSSVASSRNKIALCILDGLGQRFVAFRQPLHPFLKGHDLQSPMPDRRATIQAGANGVRTALAASDWEELAALIRADKYQPILLLSHGLP